MAANTTILNEPLFYGHNAAHRKADDLEPEEFLYRMEYILGRTNPPPTPEGRIQATAANLRGPAHTWWSLTTPNTCTEEELEEVKINWDTFKTAFTKEYFTVVNKADANINFTDFYQTSDETAYNFLQRVNNAAQLFTSMVTKEENTTPPTMAALPTTNQDEVTSMTDFATIAGPRRQRLSDIFFRRELKLHRTITKEYNDCLVLKITINGLREDKLKTVVSISAKKDESIKKAIDRLREAEVQLERPKNNHKNGGNNTTNNRNNFPKKGKPKAIHEVQEEDQEEEGINKIAKNKKAKPTKKTDKPKNNAKCNFCNLPNHSEKDCRFRINISAKMLKDVKTGKKPKGIYAQGEEEDRENYLTQAGNA